MLVCTRNFHKEYLIKCLSRLKEIQRQISALYITGDKANEHYVTLQPYMNFEETFANKLALENSIKHRKLNIELVKILEKYEIFKEINAKIQQIDSKREENANKLKALLKTRDEETVSSLKEQGKLLRNELKVLKETLYPIEDDFVHAYLALPNTLHDLCPTTVEEVIYKQTGYNALAERSKVSEQIVQFVDENRYYLLGNAALFDLQSMQALLQYFVHNAKFTALANPDFVRCVLLEANATNEQYYNVVEDSLQNKINTAFLTGSGAFESFLGAVTKLSVYASVIPLRWISCGRSYVKQQQPNANLYGVTQTNAVQAFVATATVAQADEQMELILNCAANFYNRLELPYRIIYNKASDLSQTECLRASIQVFSPSQNSYVTLGSVSNYGNYLSKRILFNIRDKDKYHFPYILGGPLLQTSRLIAALQEYKIPFENCQQLFGKNFDSSIETNLIALNKI